ncbi:hypothetical protein BJ508DRAFT_321872 [Ascobolus immersus RN42]|uniref:Uncharacterized protein n=1 Tax=Ascobolus immersus RN42 TaxID=1160509 RepID=A0A3N4IPP6_ASCIM|nr:hypothetical protein BJ508DRAFT_321872 [Ascobolus immersus RN42]
MPKNLELKDGYSQLLDQLNQLDEGPKKEKFRKMVEKVRAMHEAAEKSRPRSRPVAQTQTPQSLDPNKRRVAALKGLLCYSEMDPKDVENINAAISSYESGALDITKKTAVGERALFWGGVMMTGWVSSEATKESIDEGLRWRKNKPQGRLWVENGMVGLPAQNGFSFSLPQDANGFNNV